MEIKPKKIEIVPIVQEEPEETFIIPKLIAESEIDLLNENSPMNSIITNELPRTVNEIKTTKDLLDRCELISNIDELEEKLIELGIKFNTNPKVYLKKDYLLLICILYRALTHLYEINPDTTIVKEWLDPHSDKYVPSEKLVAETIEELSRNISQDTQNILQAIVDEAELRLEGDLELSDSLDREVLVLKGLIDNITDLIPESTTTSNQLADKQFVHDLIATNASNFRGDWSNWTSVPTNINDYPADYSGNKKPNNNDYLIVLDATDYNLSNTGIWRFYYQGNWNTLGKNGWQPQYRVEQAFSQSLLDAINSGITSTKVTTYDGYLPLILAAL